MLVLDLVQKPSAQLSDSLRLIVRLSNLGLSWRERGAESPCPLKKGVVTLMSAKIEPTFRDKKKEQREIFSLTLARRAPLL